MTLWVLPSSYKPMGNSSVSAMTPDEAGQSEVEAEMEALAKAIKSKIGDQLSRVAIDATIDSMLPIPRSGDIFEVYSDAHEPFDKKATAPEANEFTPESMDEDISAQILLLRGDNVESARVTKRVKNDHGNPVGIHYNNAILDRCEYEVEFPDGSTETHTANVIAENVYAKNMLFSKRLLDTRMMLQS
jgi:hypothetical protein